MASRLRYAPLWEFGQQAPPLHYHRGRCSRARRLTSLYTQHTRDCGSPVGLHNQAATPLLYIEDSTDASKARWFTTHRRLVGSNPLLYIRRNFQRHYASLPLLYVRRGPPPTTNTLLYIEERTYLYKTVAPLPSP